MSGSHVAEFTVDNFNSQVLQAAGPVLVDFTANWCPPCRKLAPILEALAADNAGTATFGKLNVDANQALAAQYGVENLPTMLVFKDGRPVATLVGLQSRERIQQTLDQAR
ncbi:MAG TPA: thioredoxin [Pirellulales bacterium]